MTVLMTYKLGSASAKTLANVMGIRRVRSDGDFRNNFNHKVINWGSSSEPTFPVQYGILNKPSSVSTATNKLKTLEVLTQHAVPTLQYYTNREEVIHAVATGQKLFARKTLTGNSGVGIIVIEDVAQFVYAPLYTVFFDKKREFRVHATTSGVFDYTAKLKRRGESADPYIYNHDHGRVFCRNDIELPDTVASASVAAIQALGLDFGAVDVGVDEGGNVVVFEVNSAPGLEGTTLTAYKDMLQQLIQDL